MSLSQVPAVVFKKINVKLLRIIRAPARLPPSLQYGLYQCLRQFYHKFTGKVYR
jgi:hypothetical protein